MKYIQSKSFNSVGRNISALVGCIKKLRALYEVQLLEIYKIPRMFTIMAYITIKTFFLHATIKKKCLPG